MNALKQLSLQSTFSKVIVMLQKPFYFLMTLLALACSANAEKSPEKIQDSIGIRFRLVKAGEFRMGSVLDSGRAEFRAAFRNSPDPRPYRHETPHHNVRLTRPFYVAVHEITVGQFRRFVKATNYRTTAEDNRKGIIGFSPPTKEEFKRTARKRPFQRDPKWNWKTPGFKQGEDHPVVGVSWKDANAFCKWISKREDKTYRLPTEAEWEYACRAGTSTWFSFGNQYHNRIHRYANIANVELEKKHPDMAMRQWLIDISRDPQDGFIYTAPVGRLYANSWGLHDMHGNVWEWCHDQYSATTYQQRPKSRSGQQPVVTTDPINQRPQDPHGNWRVIRGGSWCNGPPTTRSAVRAFFDANDSACYVGFRVVIENPKR